jgi:phytoene dehydrogenase-like protein
MAGNIYKRFGWSTDPASPGESAPTTEAPCPPGLNDRLGLMHTQLVRVFQRVVDSQHRGDAAGLMRHLGHFDQQLRAYLGNEEAELEDFLNARIAGDAERLLKMRQTRARLRQLARQVHEMLLPPHPSRINPALGPDAAVTFHTMQKGLAQCVRTSEVELMPLCRPDVRRDPWAEALAAVRRNETAPGAAVPFEPEIWRKVSER